MGRVGGGKRYAKNGRNSGDSRALANAAGEKIVSENSSKLINQNANTFTQGRRAHSNERMSGSRAIVQEDE